MSARKHSQVIALSLLACMAMGSLVQAAGESKVPLSLEEIASKRSAVREELMLPSLSGIKGLVYRVVGFKNYEPLEKIMGTKLALLKIPSTPFLKAESAKQPCEAIVQISFFKSGASTIAELKVIQWVSLFRNPKISVKAVTYSDKAYLVGNKPEKAVEDLSNQFVIDFLKANQKDFNAEKFSKPASAKKN